MQRRKLRTFVYVLYSAVRIQSRSVGRGDPQRSAAKRFVVLGLPSVLRKLLQLELNLCERRILGACETSVDNLLANMKFSNPSVKSCVS